MKTTFVLLLTTALFFGSAVAAPHASGDDVLKTDMLVEGIRLAKKKKWHDAKAKFTEALNYWQTNAHARLYLQIVDDFETNLIEKKIAVEAFKSIQEQFKSNHKKATKTVDKIIQKRQDYFPLFLIKGEILTNADQFDQAEQAYSTSVDLATDSLLPYLLRGKFYLKTYEREKAIADFTQALGLDSELAIVYFERGFAHTTLKKYDEAIADFEMVIKTHPDWGKSSVVIEAYHNRGVKHMERKAYTKAVNDFSRAIEIDPNYLNSYMNRGIAYRNLKRYSKAIADFGLCIENSTDPGDAYYQRGLTYYDRGDYQKAVADLRNALNAEPENKRILFKLAESYHRLGKPEAIAYFDKVIAIDPDYYWAYYWKGYACQEQRRNKQAVAAFRKFLTLAPKKYYKQRLHAEVEIKKLTGKIR